MGIKEIMLDLDREIRYIQVLMEKLAIEIVFMNMGMWAIN